MVEYSDGLDEVAHSIAHRGRRAIVATLSGGAASSSQLAQLLGIGLPALHKHLQLLRAAAPIASAKSGRDGQPHHATGRTGFACRLDRYPKAVLEQPVRRSRRSRGGQLKLPELTMNRTIRSTPERLWEAWTTEDGLASWRWHTWPLTSLKPVENYRQGWDFVLGALQEAFQVSP